MGWPATARHFSAWLVTSHIQCVASCDSDLFNGGILKK
jgi:hypothetical protein